MSCGMAKGLSSNRKCAIQELTRGCELARKLQSQLELPGRRHGDNDDDRWLELATGLSSGVLQTLTAALSLIKSKPKKVVNHSATGDRNRKVPKRRRETDSWSEVTPAPYLDGYQWRKYGQKNIHNVKYQRSYYRCTHSSDQGCPATKQVQQQDHQSVDSAPMFLVIYNNQHTCTTTKLPPPQIIVDSLQEEHKSSFWILESEKPQKEKCSPDLTTQKVSGEEMLSPQRDVCAPSTNHITSLDLSTSLGMITATGMAQEMPTASSLPADIDSCLMNPFRFFNSYGCEFDELSNLLNSVA